MASEQLPAIQWGMNTPSSTRSGCQPWGQGWGSSLLGCLISATLYFCYSCILYSSFYFLPVNPILFQFHVTGNNSLHHPCSNYCVVSLYWLNQMDVCPLPFNWQRATSPFFWFFSSPEAMCFESYIFLPHCSSWCDLLGYFFSTFVPRMRLVFLVCWF